MKKHLLFIVLIALSSLSRAQYNVPASFYGINGWMTDYIGTSSDPGNFIPSPNTCSYFPNGDFYTLSSTASMQALNLKLIRYGGTTNDINFPTNAQFQNFVNHVRNDLHAEPLIQIPFLNEWYNEGNVTAATAANNSTYLGHVANVVATLTASPYNVKYWSIGNEPDKYSTFGKTVNAQDIHDYMLAISNKIRANCSNAIIFGPDLAWSHSEAGGWAEQLIGGAYDITQNGAYGKPICDYFSFHTYPFPMCNAANCGTSIAQDPNTVSFHPTQSTAYASSFKDNLDALRSRIVHYSNNPNLKLAVTEFNINYINQSSNGIGDVSANSFVAGQWMAEMMSLGLSPTTTSSYTYSPMVDFMLPWSVHESSGDRTQRDLGIYDGSGSSLAQRSTYQHLKILSQYFTGTFYRGTSTDNYVKAFASKDCNHIYIMVLNENRSSAYVNKVRINLSPVGATAGWQEAAININCSSYITDFTLSIGTEETLVITCDACGKPDSYFRFKRTVHDGTDLPNIPYSGPGSPQSFGNTQFCTCNTGGGGSDPSGRMIGNNEGSSPTFLKGHVSVVTVPNPHNGITSLYYDLQGAESGEITVIDSYGKLMDRVQLTSTNGKADMDYTSFENGIYFITLTNSNGERITEKMIINK